MKIGVTWVIRKTHQRFVHSFKNHQKNMHPTNYYNNKATASKVQPHVTTDKNR